VRLSDIMSHMNLSTYPQAALVLFLAVFAGVVWRTYSRCNREKMQAHARAALDD
jgi:cbb3-type cytochrome oxidase subunit 3